MADLTGMVTGVDVKFEQVANRLFGWNGRNRMRTYDGVSWTNCGIARYPFVPTVAASGSSVLNGKYRYFVVPVNSKHLNQLGRVSAGLPSFKSAEVIPALQQVTVSGIPGSHPDSQVDKWYIYRNKADVYDSDIADDNQEFFFVGEVAMGTTSFVDTVHDDFLAGAEPLRFNQNTPPAFKVGGVYGHRMFGLGFDPITTGTVTKTTKTVTNKALTSNIVTLTTSAAHGYSVSDWVCVSISDATFDGPAYVLSTPSSTTFTYARIHADVASAAVGAGSSEVLTFSGVTLPDGLEGCQFQKTDDGTIYTVMGRNSTSVLAVDKLFSGALSGATYTLFRNQYEVYCCDYLDPEAWGPAGEGLRFKFSLPGKDPSTSGVTWDGRYIVFSATNIYAIEGQGPSIEDVRLLPEPLFQGIGAVGPEAVWVQDDELYFCSLRGPMVLRPGRAPEPIGGKLRTDWLDSLNATEQALICVFGDNNNVYFCYPDSGGTENGGTDGHAWRFERDTGTWWPETGLFPRFGRRYDGDSGVQGKCFYASGRELHQPDTGTLDLVSAAYSGTLTSAPSSTSANDSGAAFPTTAGGLENCMVSFFRTTAGVEALVGRRRISANTATQLSWASSGAGGGTLAVATGDRYEIGNIWWKWKSKTFEQPGHAVKVENLLIGLNAIDSSKTLIKTDYLQGSASGGRVPLVANELIKKFDLGKRCQDYAVLIESRTGVVVRTITVEAEKAEKHQ